MKSIRRISALFSIAVVVLAANVAGAIAAPSQQSMAPTLAKVVKAGKFGPVLANTHNQVFYYWDKEKNGKVQCTGGCATAWPPVIVAKGVMVPAKIMGTTGKFTVVMRPDGKHQLAFNGRPVYYYSGDKKPLQVLCDGVDGWHVVRVMATTH
jgi:predicted lipoprotein with Yx(FWY)xxD motif